MTKRGFRFYSDLTKVSAKRFRSFGDHINFQRFQANAVLEDLQSVFDIDENQLIMDFGCGTGGYSVVFSEVFKEVVAVDYRIQTHLGSSDNITFLQADLVEFNASKQADIIFCASVIEHVENINGFLESIKRNLRVGGYLYLSFPPFYSPVGGHMVKPFHYLPEKLAINLAKKLGRIRKKVSGYHDLMGDYGLFKRDIDSVTSMLKHNNFDIRLCKPRFLNINTTKIPVIKDILTWHAEFYCIYEGSKT